MRRSKASRGQDVAKELLTEVDFAYVKGEHATVTGDAKLWGHGFNTNQRVVLAKNNVGDLAEKFPAGWLCLPEEDPHEGSGWWVAEADLEADRDIDAEVAEAIESIKSGPVQKPHCPTCTCGS